MINPDSCSEIRSEKEKVLIGPLPPPWGGARVSFQMFYEYVNAASKNRIRHFEIPFRNARYSNPAGKVNHFKTLMKVFASGLRIPFADSVIVFGSRNFCFSYGLFLLLISKLFRKTFYMRIFGGHPAQTILFRPPFVQNALFKMIKLVDRIIVETKVGALEFPYDIQRKIFVIVGYRSSFTCDPPKADRSNSIIRFVYVGGITKEKGIPDLLSAFREMQSRAKGSFLPELHLYGTGPKEIVDKVTGEQRGVIYHGPVDNSDIRRSLPGYDVFVFPSNYKNEGHPGVVVEAMMAALPIIATDLTGPCEIVKHEISGLIVNAGDCSQLADAMIRIAENKDLRKQLSTGALESSRDFTAENVLPDLAAAVGIKV